MPKKSTPPRSAKQRIKPETKRVILEALDKEFFSAGLPEMENAAEVFRQLVKKGIESEEEFAAASVASALMLLLGDINDMQEPTAEELELLLAKIKRMRFELKGILDKTIKTLKRQLPRKPGGGRPSSLKPEQKREACAKIGALLANGVSLQNAMQRVAQFYGVGKRSIQRAWQSRGKTHPQRSTG